MVYRSEFETIRWAVPEPLEPDGPDRVFYEWIAMHDGPGFGGNSESGIVIPSPYRGAEFDFAQPMDRDNDPPITVGRER